MHIHMSEDEHQGFDPILSHVREDRLVHRTSYSANEDNYPNSDE